MEAAESFPKVEQTNAGDALEDMNNEVLSGDESC